MSINLSIRNYRIIIAGLDCTPAIVSFDGSDSKLDQSGLVIFTGTIALGRPAGFESIDDRHNTRWARGKAITIEIADKSGTLRPAPRGARLFILNAQFDLKSRKLTLQVGDAFALLNFREGKGDKSGICLGTQTSRGDIIGRLLLAAGVGGFADTVPGTLSAPMPRLLEGSYIEQAGAIAAAAGYFLYIDRNGQARAKPVATTASRAFAISLDSGVVDYRRLEGEQAPSRVLVRGRATIVRPTGDLTITESTETGLSSAVGFDSNTGIILGRKRVEDRFDRGNKVRTIESWESKPAGLVMQGWEQYVGSRSLIDAEYKIERYFYETNSPLKDGDTKCQQGNQGRLLRYEVQRYLPKGVIFQEALQAYPPNSSERLGLTTLLLAEETITQYRYEDSSTSELSPVNGGGSTEVEDETQIEAEKLGNSPLIITRTYQPLGAVLPQDFAPNPNILLMESMRSMHVTERNRTYYREPKFGEWHKFERIDRGLAIAFPDAADRLRASLQKRSKAYYPSNLLELATVQDTITISNSGQTQPPAPDTYPPPFSTQEVTVTGKADLPVDAETPYRQRTREFGFEYLEATGSSQSAAVAAARDAARQLARSWGVILWGRDKAASVTSDLQDDWFTYEPLNRIDVIEPDAVAAYLGDGFAIAMSEGRCVASFDGILLGFTTLSQPQNVAPIYQIRFEDELALAFGFADRFGDYDRSPIQVSDNFAIAFAIKPQADDRGEFAIGFAFRDQANMLRDRLAIAAAFDSAGSLYWEEMTPEQWAEITPLQWGNILP